MEGDEKMKQKARTGTNHLYHVSMEFVDEFIPRIPDTRLIDENSYTPRICCAPTIEQGVEASPGILSGIKMAMEIGFSPILHVYELFAPEESIYRPTEEDVPDADRSDEVWILEEPSDWELRSYNVADMKSYKQGDGYEVCEYLELVPCENRMDNYDAFCAFLGVDESAADTLRSEYRFRSILNLINADEGKWKEFFLQIRNR